MPTDFRMYFDDEPAEEEVLDLFGVVRVDQSIGLVTEASLDMDLALDEAGVWSDFEREFVQPGVRVRIEVKVGDGDFVPLMDGSIVGQRFDLSGAPNASKLVLLAHDDSVLLSREERVTIFEDMAASDIATDLFTAAGLSPEVEATADAAGDLERVVVQRGTALQLLRVLAKRHGKHVYVKPGPEPGASIGVFAALDLSPSDLPEMLLIGAERNVNQLEVEFDGLRPTVARASSITASDLATQAAEAGASSARALGDVPAHDVVEPSTVLLARTREQASDLEAAVAATVDFSSWAYTAHGEVDGQIYPAVLSPYRVVSVAGIGHLSGEYLISRVTHVLNDDSYTQQFGLRRNAHSELSGGGGIPGGVF